jgi:flagellar biosynthesis protein FlhF
MTTKTFKSETVLGSLQQVQSELGADAIVVSMREVPLGPVWNPWKKAGVEVVATAAKPKPTSVPQAKSKGIDIVEERPEIEWDWLGLDEEPQLPPPIKLNAAPLNSVPKAEPVPPQPQKNISAAHKADRYVPSELKKLRKQLNEQGVDEILLEDLLTVVIETHSAETLANPETLKASLIELLGIGLRTQKGAGKFVAEKMICLVGASGSGKTSTAAKLALYFTQQLKKKVTWVCADTIRTGAIAEARAYTDALGVNLKLVYTPEDLRAIVENAQEGELYIVDTPGYNPYNEKEMVELGALLTEMPQRCTYLTTSATTKESDLLQASAALGIFNIDGLVLTKLDETQTFGTLYNFTRKYTLPLAFFTTGRETAKRLEVASPTRFAEALFGKSW